MSNAQLLDMSQISDKYMVENKINKIRVEGTQCYYEPLFFWIASIFVMLTVQIYIFHEFFPAKMGGGEIQEWK